MAREAWRRKTDPKGFISYSILNERGYIDFDPHAHASILGSGSDIVPLVRPIKGKGGPSRIQGLEYDLSVFGYLDGVRLLEKQVSIYSRILNYIIQTEFQTEPFPDPSSLLVAPEIDQLAA